MLFYLTENYCNNWKNINKKYFLAPIISQILCDFRLSTQRSNYLIIFCLSNIVLKGFNDSGGHDSKFSCSAILFLIFKVLLNLSPYFSSAEALQGKYEFKKEWGKKKQVIILKFSMAQKHEFHVSFCFKVNTINTYFAFESSDISEGLDYVIIWSPQKKPELADTCTLQL